ncbi:alginate lyase family protein [Streptomyces sp. SL13]|uniref:Alginate lyase family protein n=2 Tax=Streptantibioticus silvisoli TaxID=2705255 RepID=A0AA90H5E4_9ACTN|nr:alginate lyase family protein [Streptantibioticus silvisoli]MDI5970697.1 alginate lyase family protein [Streptantibioticus silvisoli]
MRRTRSGSLARKLMSVAAVAGLFTALAISSPASAATSPAAASPAAASPAAGPGGVPRTVVLDGPRLALTRLMVRAGAPQLRGQVSSLKAQADSYLTQGPWSVMDKPQTPPSGDKHDYLSQAPYWWPSQPATASNPQGCPYVDRDGVRNPEVDTITDHSERGEMFNAVYDLTLAWYYTGDPAYGKRAALDLETWFIDPATRMNPNLTYTQGIPCQLDGRGIGIIDFSQQFTDILDAVALLNTGAPGWSHSDNTAMTGWDTQFLNWLMTSSNGADEAAATNNHGSFFDMQEAALALAVGRPGLAKSIAETAETKRLDVQLAADGSQPLELSRTLPFHYSTFNLLALTRLAMIGQKVGVDLWHYRTPAGGSIFKAVDFLVPAATGTASWSYPDLNFQAWAATDVIEAAADAGDHTAGKALPDLTQPPGGEFWLLRPAPEQLDPVTS